MNVACNRRGAGARAAATHGFTLIEVLLATAVLAFGLTLGIAALRAASSAVQRGEEEAQRTEQVRVAQQFLRRQIGATRPAVFEQDPDTFETKVFKGEPDQMQYVAPMPGYLSRGGTYLQTLTLSSDGDHDRLDFESQMLVGDALIEENPRRPPVPLLEGLSEAHFEYRGIDETGVLSSWLPRWELQEHLPLQIRIKAQFADEAVIWPPFVVALPLAQSQSAAPAQLDSQEPADDEGDTELQDDSGSDGEEKP